jgi:hypothetical protein
MTPSNTENTSFVSNHCPAELWYAKSILECHFMRLNFVYVEEVNGLASPLEIVDKFIAGVTFLQDEGVVEQLVEFIHHIKFLIISYSTGEFPQLAHLINQISLNLIELGPDGVKSVEVPLYFVLFDLIDF